MPSNGLPGQTSSATVTLGLLWWRGRYSYGHARFLARKPEHVNITEEGGGAGGGDWRKIIAEMVAWGVDLQPRRQRFYSHLLTSVRRRGSTRLLRYSGRCISI